MYLIDGPCLHNLAFNLGLLTTKKIPWSACMRVPPQKPCTRKHYKHLRDLSNLTKFRAVQESINPATHQFTGSTAIFAGLVYDAMTARIVPDTTPGAAPGSLMVNTA